MTPRSLTCRATTRRDRLGTDGARPDHLSDARAVLAKYGIDEPEAVIAHLTGRGRRDAEAGRSGLRQHPVRADRQPAAGADRRCGRRPGAPYHADRAERSDRGRGARHRGDACRDRGAIARRPIPRRRRHRHAAGGAVVGGEDHRHVQGKRPRRAQRDSGSRSPPRWLKIPAGRSASRRSPATPMASTEPRTMRGRLSTRTRSPAPRLAASPSKRRWPRTMRTDFSPPSAIS